MSSGSAARSSTLPPREQLDRRVSELGLRRQVVSRPDLVDLCREGGEHSVSVGVSEEGKAGLVVGVTDDLTATYDAVELARIGAEALGGKGGGGRPDLAQAGGPDGSRVDQALEAIAARVAALTGAPATSIASDSAETKRRAGRA